jgi:hypothetical protein
MTDLTTGNNRKVLLTAWTWLLYDRDIYTYTKRQRKKTFVPKPTVQTLGVSVVYVAGEGHMNESDDFISIGTVAPGN